jgi:AcrR family transcriptional regulator
MNGMDHRSRVAAERRQRMRLRLLCSGLKLAATKEPGSMSIDDVISTADVSRGTFYKYFPSVDALVQALVVEIADELISLAEPVILRLDDPARRVSCGIRLVSRLASSDPVVAGFVLHLGWPQAQGPGMLLSCARRDIEEGFRLQRFQRMPTALALNIIAGAVLGAAQRRLSPDSEDDFAEQTAAAALRSLGVDVRAAELIAMDPLDEIEIRSGGLLAGRLTSPTMTLESRCGRMDFSAFDDLDTG